MRIELESLEPRFRSGHALKCLFCWGGFVAAGALANAFSDDGEIFAGHVCPGCIAHGEVWLERRLESNARFSREMADEEEELSLEGISEMPSLEEYRIFDRIAALD
jgi:hypothetical protein